MKKFLLSTVALATMTAGAMAADLTARRMAPAPYAAIPVFTWTGFYVGANVGAAWNGNRRDDAFAFRSYSAGGVTLVPVAGTTFPGDGGGFGFGNDRDRTSILGGVQIGYNWQVTPGSGFVIGVEADIQAIGNRNNRNNGFFGVGNGFGTAVPVAGVVALPVALAPGNVAFFNNNNGLLGNGNGNGGDWFGTARLRVGYAVDRALFYVTGGLAFTDGSNRNNNGFFGGNNFGGTSAGIPAPFFVGAAPAPAVVATNTGFFGNNDRNNIGWALGGGVEYAFTNSLSAKIEYLHVEFDRNNNNFGGTRVVGVTNTGAAIVNNGGVSNRGRNNGIDLVRVGLNFRFSGF